MFLRNNTKKELILLIAIICAILLINIDARKRKKKPKAPKKPYNPKDRKPARINENLWCDVCKAIVKETAKSLYGKSKDYEVIDAIEKVCDAESDFIYPHCILFFDNYFFLFRKIIRKKIMQKVRIIK